MQYRTLGKTGIQISALSFGAGPISTIMVGDDHQRQRMLVSHALQQGVNWFDTAPTYGDGRSERNLGRLLQELGVAMQVHVATKVRLTTDDLGDIPSAVRRSLTASLQRLRLPRVTLLQLHNSITRRRGDEPTSITPDDVLRSGGVADVFEELRSENLVLHLGLTGIGNAASLAHVARSERFETMQVPYHLLNPSAGREILEDFEEANYGNIIATCSQLRIGVLAIRVLAGGALADNPPSPHTFKTPFFPLDLYERDRQRAARLRAALEPMRRLPQEAVRFALTHPSISSVLVGFRETWQIEEAVEALEPDVPPLNWDDVLSLKSYVEVRE